MTCVIGYRSDNGIWIGADSAGTNGFGQQTLRADTKVFTNGSMLFGFCGSFRMGQLLQFRLDVQKQPDGMDDFEYMVTRFVEDVRHTLTNGGYSYIKNNTEFGGNFLVAFKDQIYEIEDDYQVGLSTRPYVCIGSGADVANGAMGILAGSDASPVSAIKAALMVAARHDAFVASPFVVKKHRS